MTLLSTPPPPAIVPVSRLRRMAVLGVAWAMSAATLKAAGESVVVEVTDWAAMPFSGDLSTASGIPGYMARVNFMHEEPGGSGRMWVCDLNGNLHVFDGGGSFATRTAGLLQQAHGRDAYLDFNGQSATAVVGEMTHVPNAAGTSTASHAPDGLFPRFTKRQGYANGLVTFEFDPGYPDNGRFYTVHIESVSPDGDPARLPVATKFPGFDTAGYTSTPVVNPAGGVSRHAVLIEWTDTEPANSTFEGTARELLRMGYNSHIHPLGDLTFDPTAKPGDPEWGVMYLANGDGGSGESNATGDDGFPWLSGGDRHFSPQRLDALVGKILRIVPDLSLHTGTSRISANGRYRVPLDNPFADGDQFPGARPEVWTYGHRNPHRFAWHIPADPAARRLLVTDIGLDVWEEVNLLSRGANYGYAEREGPQKLTISTNPQTNRTVGPLPSPDDLPLRITGNVSAPGDVTPVYPVVAYPHTAAFGDAISSGFVYHGTSIPALRGKFLFGDITTGRLFYCEVDEMIDSDDGDPATTAAIHPVTLRWDDPHDSPDAGTETYERMFEIVEAGYQFRGGVDENLPGGANVSGDGRADIRLATDAAGEIYITSKSDGMIRMLGAAEGPEIVTQPGDQFIESGQDARFTAEVAGSPPPSYQWQRLPAGGATWEDISNDSTFEGAKTASLGLDAPDYNHSGDRFQLVVARDGVFSVSNEARLEIRALPSAWLADHFSPSEQGDFSIAGDLADPDHDKLENLIEFAFGFDPRSDSSADIPRIVREGDKVVLSFPAPRSNLEYSVESSADLASWTIEGVSLSRSGDTVTATLPIHPPERAFLRVVVRPE